MSLGFFKCSAIFKAFVICLLLHLFFGLASSSSDLGDDALTYLWPLPAKFSSGNQTLSVDPALALTVSGNGGRSPTVKAAFDRYKRIIFKHAAKGSIFDNLRARVWSEYDISRLKIIVHSASEELQLGVDESYSVFVSGKNKQSIIGEATIEANTIYGALRGLETFGQLCAFNYATKSVQVYRAPWYIQDKPRFAFRGLLIDTSRHFLPTEVIKQIIESMSYAKLNVLHWHIVDEESFPLETSTYPNLWKGAYSEWERYTIEDAYEIVRGYGYPDLWPSPSCKEPLDVSKNFTFDVIAGILTDLRKVFPFELIHLGGDEVHTDCWSSTPHVKQWLQDRQMTAKDAYQYFVVKAQEIAISRNWTPVNWEETFKTFADKLSPQTVVHNWLESGICPRAVAKGFRCIFSNQRYWYLDHLDVPWNKVYTAEPLEGVDDASLQKLVIGGQVCMWGEMADASDIQQTIWPRAAAAAERMWSTRESVDSGDIFLKVLPRLHYFRCLLNRRGIAAAPVSNFYARQPPSGPGSCYEQ